MEGQRVLLGTRLDTHTYKQHFPMSGYNGAVFSEKLTDPQLVKKFPAFYGTRRFTAAFTTARH
jgi:hypothetical protein